MMMKLGPTTTVSALVIQGPFQKEDRRDTLEHKRQVLSALLNVSGEEAVSDFLELGTKHESAMFDYCLS